MNRLQINPDALYWMNIGGCAVQAGHISCVFDNGEGISVCVVGMHMYIRLTYAEAAKVFKGWDAFKILPSAPRTRTTQKKSK